MKKLAVLLVLLMFSVPAFSMSNPSKLSHNPSSENEVIPFTEEEVRAIERRVMEIKEMDRSELTREEKKALRIELREMRRDIKERDEHHHHQGGIFISTGAIILILLLIIIL